MRVVGACSRHFGKRQGCLQGFAILVLWEPITKSRLLSLPALVVKLGDKQGQKRVRPVMKEQQPSLAHTAREILESLTENKVRLGLLNSETLGFEWWAANSLNYEVEYTRILNR